MNEAIFIKNPRFVLTPTLEYSVEILENKDILVQDGIITCIGSNCGKPRGSLLIDASDKIVLPAHISTYTLSTLYFLDGSFIDLDYKDWSGQVKAIIDELTDYKLAFHSSRLSCLEMLLNGVIGFIDMSPHPEPVINACTDLGLYVMAGPLNPSINEYLAFKHRIGKKKKFRPVINISRLLDMNIEDIKSLVSALENENILINISASNTRRDVFQVWKKYRRWPIELLYVEGVLGSNTLLVNPSWITSMELEYVKERKSKITIAPGIVLRFVYGSFYPLYEAIKKDIVTGGGLSGGIGGGYNILTEIGELVLYYRHQYWDTRLKTELAYSYLTLSNYKIMGLKGGILSTGEPANMVIYDVELLWRANTNKKNLLPKLLFSEQYYVDKVIAFGEVMYDRQDHDRLLDSVKESIDYIHGISDKIKS